MVADTPDFTKNINIVGTQVTLNVNIAAAGVTLNVNISSTSGNVNVNLNAAAVTLNINFSSQSASVQSSGEYRATQGQQFFNVASAIVATGVVGSLATAFPGGGLAAYVEGVSFVALTLVVPTYTYAYLQVGGVTVMYIQQAQGGVTIFKTPIKVASGGNIQMFGIWNGGGGGNATLYGSLWGYLL